MERSLTDRTVAFLTANEGVEQIEPTSPRQAVDVFAKTRDAKTTDTVCTA